MDDKTLTMTLLFDFFGDLLTEKQREYFDLYYNEDLSLSEIAEKSGISRQGVRDNIIRAESALIDYEKKTGIIKRFSETQAGIIALENDVNSLLSISNSSEERDIALKMLEKLQDMKG